MKKCSDHVGLFALIQFGQTFLLLFCVRYFLEFLDGIKENESSKLHINL